MLGVTKKNKKKEEYDILMKFKLCPIHKEHYKIFKDSVKLSNINVLMFFQVIIRCPDCKQEIC